MPLEAMAALIGQCGIIMHGGDLRTKSNFQGYSLYPSSCRGHSRVSLLSIDSIYYLSSNTAARRNLYPRLREFHHFCAGRRLSHSQSSSSSVSGCFPRSPGLKNTSRNNQLWILPPHQQSAQPFLCTLRRSVKIPREI